MKIALGIVSGLIVLLGVMFILNRRKKCSSCSSKETLTSKPKVLEQEKQQPKIKSAAKIAVNVEPTSVNDHESVNKPISNAGALVKPQAKETEAVPAQNNSSGFPQDSIQRRHYLTHLCMMIEALAPQCPTDSVLCRHYYMMLITKIDQCLNDKKVMERLIYDYENLNA